MRFCCCVMSDRATVTACVISVECSVQDRSLHRWRLSIRRRWSFSWVLPFASRVQSTVIHGRSSHGPRTRTLSTSAGKDSGYSELGRGCTSPTLRRRTPDGTRVKLRMASVQPPSPSTSTLSVSRALLFSRNSRKLNYCRFPRTIRLLSYVYTWSCCLN